MLLMLLACVPWTVIQDGGEPSPLYGLQGVAIQSDWSALRVGPEPVDDWVSELKPDAAEDYDKGAVAAQAAFDRSLMRSLGELPVAVDQAQIVVVMRPSSFEPGTYSPLVTVPTDLRAQVAFVVNGEVVEAIEVRSQQTPDIYNDTLAIRMSSCGDQLGQATAAYLDRRRSGKSATPLLRP